MSLLLSSSRANDPTSPTPRGTPCTRDAALPVQHHARCPSTQKLMAAFLNWAGMIASIRHPDIHTDDSSGSGLCPSISEKTQGFSATRLGTNGPFSAWWWRQTAPSPNTHTCIYVLSTEDVCTIRLSSAIFLNNAPWRGLPISYWLWAFLWWHNSMS